MLSGKRTGTIMLSVKELGQLCCLKKEQTFMLPEKELGQLHCLRKKWDNYGVWKKGTGTITLPERELG